METRVSMVNEPCRRLARVALWKGAPPQKKMGVTMVSTAHCQLVNCSAGIMLSKTTGTVSAAETIRRCLRSAVSRSLASSIWSRGPAPPPAEVASTAWSSSFFIVNASYPAPRTVSMSASVSTLLGSKEMDADSVAKLTVASTPSSLLSLRSTRPEHEVQVMPVTPRSMSIRSTAGCIWEG